MNRQPSPSPPRTRVPCWKKNLGEYDFLSLRGSSPMSVLTCLGGCVFLSFCNFRICRGKCPANPRKQHWKPNAPEYGLDTWVRPWTRWQGDRWANSSHAEAKRIRSRISSTKKHPRYCHSQFREVHLRRKAKKRCFTIFIHDIYPIVLKLQHNFCFWSRNLHCLKLITLAS